MSLKLSIVKGHIKAGKHIRGKEKTSERGLIAYQNISEHNPGKIEHNHLF